MSDITNKVLVNVDISNSHRDFYGYVYSENFIIFTKN